MWSFLKSAGKFLGICVVILYVLVNVFMIAGDNARRTEQSQAGYQPEYEYAVGEENVIFMYSLTSCGRCAAKRRELQDSGLAFEEYFIDQDAEKDRELQGKLRRSGFTGYSFGTPVFVINGNVIMNNPPLSKLRSYLK